MPEVMFWRFGVRHMPCPVHGAIAGRVKLSGWNSAGPRKVIGSGESYYVMFK